MSAFFDPSVNTVKGLERFDTETNTWHLLAASGVLPNHEAAFARQRDGTLFAAGGFDFDQNTPIAASARLEAPLDHWAPAAPLPTPGYPETAVELPDGRVLLIGGVIAVYDPVADSWTVAGS